MSEREELSVPRGALLTLTSAIAAVGAWLGPIALIAIVAPTAEGGTWLDRVFDGLTIWGYTGVIGVPVLAFWLGLKISRSNVVGGGAAAVGLISYIPVALITAIAWLIASDSSFGP